MHSREALRQSGQSPFSSQPVTEAQEKMREEGSGAMVDQHERAVRHKHGQRRRRGERARTATRCAASARDNQTGDGRAIVNQARD